VEHAVTVHADIVGSLLRPRDLLEARESYAVGGLSAAEFKRIEDRAVDWAIGLQERAGLPVVTDGEMRRESFQSQMVEATDGFGEHDIDAWLWGSGTATRRWETGRRSVPRPSGSSANCGAYAISPWKSSCTPGDAPTGS
jgi:5-methyltetrahydropteroyltriglutamate--homocysteine methyltransferase